MVVTVVSVSVPEYVSMLLFHLLERFMSIIIIIKIMGRPCCVVLVEVEVQVLVEVQVVVAVRWRCSYM